MFLTLLIILSLLLLTLYLITRFRNIKKGIYLPDAFLIGLLFFVIGSITLKLKYEDYISYNILELSLTALSSGLIGSIIGSFVKEKNKRKVVRDNFVFKVLAFFASFISLLFIYSIITNQSIFTQLSLFFIDNSSGYNEIRKQITSGNSGYLAPGYIKQFRDIMGSIVIGCIILIKPKNKFLYYIPALIILVAMLFSGQRGVIFSLLLLIMLLSVNNIFSINSILYGSIILLVFSTITFLLGRSDMYSENFFLVDAFNSIFERIVLTLPQENYNSFYLWYDNITYGSSWLSELEKILPGTNFGLSNTLHTMNMGSYEGNSVLGLSIDLYYAFGRLGVIIFPIIYALLFSIIDLRVLNNNSKVIYVSKLYLFTQIPFIFSPYGFILYGGIFVLFLNLILKYLERLKYDFK